MEATAALGVPVVMNTSWGGLQLDEVPAHVCMVNDVPYDWLFSHVGQWCTGGSGTTHSALRFSLPQLIVPHIADQFFWARCIVASGLGPTNFPIKALTKESFNTRWRSSWPRMSGTPRIRRNFFSCFVENFCKAPPS